MRKTFKFIQEEALVYGINLHKSQLGYIQFTTSNGDIPAWMIKDGNKWLGFTSEPDATGKKVGSKAQVADWCMDWAANGF